MRPRRLPCSAFPLAMLLAVPLAMLPALPVFAQADSSSEPDGRDEMIQKLLNRVDALEREVAALQPGQAKPAQEPEPAPKEASQQSSEAPQPAADNAGRFTFHGYADVGFLRNQAGASDD